MTLALDPQLKGNFDANGFVAVREFLSPGEVADMHRHLERLIRDTLPLLPSNKVMYEDKARPETFKQIANLHQLDPFFGRFAFGDRVIGLAELLLGPHVRFDSVQYFNKPPRVGRETPPHQDGYYWMLEPNEGLTMWLALDPVDDENGCVRYIPGSHRAGLRPHARTNTLGFSQGIAEYGDADKAPEVAMHAQPGDLLVHHALTIHRADNNNSTRSRRALGATFFAAHVREDAVAKERYRKSLEQELAAVGKL